MPNVRLKSTGWWLALVVGAGYFVAHAMTALFAGALLESWMASDVPLSPPQIRRSGTLVFVRYDAAQTMTARYFSREGDELTRPGENASGGFDASELVASSTDVPGIYLEESQRDMPPDRLARLWKSVEGTSWFARRDSTEAERGYLEGYHIPSRRLIGYVSTRGFTLTRPVPADQWRLPSRESTTLEQAFVDTRHHYQAYEATTAADGTVLRDQPIPTHLTFLAARDGLWEVDLRGRRTRRLLDLEGILAVRRISAPLPVEGQEGQTSAESLLLRTAEKLVVVEPVSGTRRDYPLPEDARELPSTAYAIHNGGLAITRNLGNLHRYDPSHLRVWWFDKTGQLERTLDTPALPQSEQLKDQPWFTGLIATVMAPSPVVPVIGWWSETERESRLHPAYKQREVSPDNHVALMWLTAGTISVAILLALRAMRVARRYGNGVPWQWGLFVLLLGLPGYIGLMYAKRRLAVAQCEWLRGEPLVIPPRLSTDVVVA